ncbi:MAG: tRNA (adenosine(37)-N6)-threonylcarbamoyltransferase complex ATPase subunit type 1 TsaE [Chloroflexota bacterium]|nr:MAG: tRNA (adenosine(37)-N6)-threonylcarbamoyltransferase complex ATPase subunit type 1 TsaE [Chloroflexota bacterium]
MTGNCAHERTERYESMPETGIISAMSEISWTYTSRSLAQTEHIGVQLGTLLQSGDVLCLVGDLGTGKTAFARGVAAGWRSTTAVTSPTFVLIHEHQRDADAMRLQHIDAYRLERLEDAALLGLEDIFASESAVIIEWADRIAPLLPEDRLWIEFALVPEDEQARQLTFSAHGLRGTALLSALRKAFSA